MERIISDEEKLRRAIEISQRRNNNYYRMQATRVNVQEKKDYKLFKKMILQIVICLLIYTVFHLISTTNYVFSDEVIKSMNEILNYDINFQEIYNNFMMSINKENSSIENNSIVPENNIQETLNNTIQTNEQIKENSSVIQENEVVNVVENKTEELSSTEKKETDTKNEEKTQMEIDAEAVKRICEFTKPLSGTITSEFGTREATIEGMTTDHKGIDIANKSGTNIKAAMAGTVSVAEENNEYGKFIKIVNEDTMTVYAHCQKLKVKVGDEVKIGQTIATVGSTGNSTGPHLHFEIRFENRYINPRYVINF